MDDILDALGVPLALGQRVVYAIAAASLPARAASRGRLPRLPCAPCASSARTIWRRVAARQAKSAPCCFGAPLAVVGQLQRVAQR